MEFERLDKDALAALKSRALPRCRGADMMQVGEGGDAAEGARLMALADTYFAQFLPKTDSKCVCCGWELTGFVGSFTWGLTNGEGFCGRCKYPARAIHRIAEVGTLRHFVLQYHPDELSFDDERAA